MTTWPIPGRPITSPYGIRGSHWKACGFHTGADIAAPTGTPILAPEAGRIVYVAYGTSFGSRQLVLRPPGGGEWFFAHCSWRRSPGDVPEGAHIANVGAEGNATGPHLHLEWHTRPGWSCDRMADPAPRLATPAPAPTPPEPEPEDDDMKWLVNLGPQYGWWVTDFATYRTGISVPAVGQEGVATDVWRWYADGREVGDGWKAHVMKLPRIDG